MIKKMKISSFWRFPGSEWESATLSPNFHLQFHFFSCSFVFDGFPLIFMVFLDFRCHGQGKWKNDKNMIKKMKISSFLKISWFRVRICNFESKFSFFFHLQFHFFFHVPLFLMVSWTFLRYTKKCSETKNAHFPKKCYKSSKSAHLVVSFCWHPHMFKQPDPQGFL